MKQYYLPFLQHEHCIFIFCILIMFDIIVASLHTPFWWKTPNFHLHSNEWWKINVRPNICILVLEIKRIVLHCMLLYKKSIFPRRIELFLIIRISETKMQIFESWIPHRRKVKVNELYTHTLHFAMIEPRGETSQSSHKKISVGSPVSPRMVSADLL